MQCRGDLRRLTLPIKGGDSEKDIPKTVIRLWAFLLLERITMGTKKFIELLDTTSNEDDFLLEATKYLGF